MFLKAFYSMILIPFKSYCKLYNYLTVRGKLLLEVSHLLKICLRYIIAKQIHFDKHTDLVGFEPHSIQKYVKVDINNNIELMLSSLSLHKYHHLRY